jgi:hypothetical protein
MKYKLRGGNHDLIHVLRFLMAPEGVGVLDRTWEVQCIYSTIAYKFADDMPLGAENVFPEFGDKAPFKVSGTRLVERAALVPQFDETVVVRLCEGSPDGYDLLFYADLGHPLAVETSDDGLYLKLKEYFESTCGDEHYKCFW